MSVARASGIGGDCVVDMLGRRIADGNMGHSVHRRLLSLFAHGGRKGRGEEQSVLLFKRKKRAVFYPK
jgi:hypothetical protein